MNTKLKRPGHQRQHSFASSFVKVNGGLINHRDQSSAISRLKGSVWANVFPFCVANSLLAVVVVVLRHHRYIDFSFNDQGHTFLSILVSFLLVTRSTIAYHRYSSSLSHLINITRCIGELVLSSVTASRYETGEKARDWRMTLSRQSITLANSMMGVLKTQHIEDLSEYKKINRFDKEERELSKGRVTTRTPTILAMFLRTTIASHVNVMEEKTLDVNEELAMHKHLHVVMKSYYACLMTHINPLPFPFVQMARIFLFVWIYTLPFALDSKIDRLVPICLVIFCITYFFFGLEFVSIAMDDPYGDDPTDLNLNVVFMNLVDQVVIIVRDMDGHEAADSLELFSECSLETQVREAVRDHGSRGYSAVATWSDIKESLVSSSKALPQIKEIDGDSSFENSFHNDGEFAQSTTGGDSQVSFADSLGNDGGFALPTPRGGSQVPRRVSWSLDFKNEKDMFSNIFSAETAGLEGNRNAQKQYDTFQDS